MYSFTGAVETLQDAIFLFEACRLGYLKRVQRRLNESEKRAFIQPGRVFIWDEEEAQIRRWTDSRVWSPSRRFLERFLTYFEIESKHPSHPSNTAESNGDGSSNSSGPVVPKQGGLSKRCLSVHTVEGRHLHLVAYYGGKSTDAIADKEAMVRPHLHPLLVPVAEQIMSSEGFRHYPDLWQAWPPHAAPPVGFSPYLWQQPKMDSPTRSYGKHRPRASPSTAAEVHDRGDAKYPMVSHIDRNVRTQPRLHSFKPYQYRPASTLVHAHLQQKQEQQKQNQSRLQLDQVRPNFRKHPGQEQEDHSQPAQSSQQQLLQHQQQQQEHYARQSEAYELYMQYSRSQSPSPGAGPAIDVDPRYALPTHADGAGTQYLSSAEYGYRSPKTYTTPTPPLAHGNGIHSQPAQMSSYGGSRIYNGTMLCKPAAFHQLSPHSLHHETQQHQRHLLDSSGAAAARMQPRGLGGISVDELLGRRLSPYSSRSGSNDEAAAAAVAARAVENQQGSKTFQQSSRRSNSMAMVG
ncbi:hypothetical protein HDU86_006973 [Geranomyces michiganensis]|nr:hypothetical protein HDU86_006973 [Geranomyces michiganensis]